MAVLAGDFLLARASVALARLRNVQVLELLATVIANLVEGEFMQLRNGSKDGKRFDYYLEKTYLKTASLIAKSCRACAVLGGCGESVAGISYDYGRNIGMSFQVSNVSNTNWNQLIDDMLDFTAISEQLGKPANADLKLGLATAPVLFAADEFPILWELIDRKFNQPGDVEMALELALKSDGIEKTRRLAGTYVDGAVNAVMGLPESKARDALVELTRSVLNRSK
jgi:hexaprenyl-diphosphate synthase